MPAPRYFRRVPLPNLDEVPEGARVHAGFGLSLYALVEVPEAEALALRGEAADPDPPADVVPSGG